MIILPVEPAIIVSRIFSG